MTPINKLRYYLIVFGIALMVVSVMPMGNAVIMLPNHIAWGEINQGSVNEHNITVTNMGNINAEVTLFADTNNYIWFPPVTFSIDSGETKQVTVYLHVSNDAPIVDFNFNIENKIRGLRG